MEFRSFFSFFFVVFRFISLFRPSPFNLYSVLCYLSSVICPLYSAICYLVNSPILSWNSGHSPSFCFVIFRYFRLPSSLSFFVVFLVFLHNSLNYLLLFRLFLYLCCGLISFNTGLYSWALKGDPPMNLRLTKMMMSVYLFEKSHITVCDAVFYA